MRPERLKDVPLVQEGINQVWIVRESMSQAAVDNFQHHPQDLLQYGQVLNLESSHDGCTGRVRDAFGQRSARCRSLGVGYLVYRITKSVFAIAPLTVTTVLSAGTVGCALRIFVSNRACFLASVSNRLSNR